MVDDLYERLCLPAVIGRHKDKGISLDALVRGMLAYKMGENFSVLQAGEWLNRQEVREHYELPSFNVKDVVPSGGDIGTSSRTYRPPASGPRPEAS